MAIAGDRRWTYDWRARFNSVLAHAAPLQFQVAQMTEVFIFASGVVMGAVVALLVALRANRRIDGAALALEQQARNEKENELRTILSELRGSFAELSRDALSANSEDFLKLATTRLDKQTTQGDLTLENKKKLIDARLEELNKRLNSLGDVIQAIEKDRNQSHGVLKGQIEKTTQATMRLSEATSQLQSALANPQQRGQWGERMAEDILNMAGLIEGINYRKQSKLAEGTIPDFTFLLPDDQCVHMDAKFPLASYMKLMDCQDENARAGLTDQFLRDVRARIREVTTRQYINPAEGTLDFVLVFIPNEQIFSFINEKDSAIVDDALSRQVILCSPLTLYAIVAIIHQSVSTLRLQRSSRQVLDLLNEFRKLWEKYAKSMAKMGEKLEAASREYDNLIGVRTRTLDRQLDKIDALQSQELMMERVSSD